VKRTDPFRLLVLAVATLAASMLWMPAVAAVLSPQPLNFDPFLVVGRVWWSVQLFCSVLTVALTVVAVMRGDFISIFGFASALSVFFGAPVLFIVLPRVL